MSLTPEWRRRINAWRQELPRHFYHVLGSIPLNGFLTREHLSLEEALSRSMGPMPAGTSWGAKWEYGWFRGGVELSEGAVGQRIAVAVDAGGESAVYVNGAAAGSVDRHHRYVTLATQGMQGASYEIMVECYAGHGPRVSSVGPVPPGRQSVTESPTTQCVVGESTFGVWREQVYQLWLDVETLYQLRENLDTESLRVAEIDEALRDFTLIVDFERPRDEMLSAVTDCRERLAPLLSCENGSTAPAMYAFGHSHIDVAWLWPLAETERKCLRTFGTQLALMEQYPEYRFLQSQPHLYWMVKRLYPQLYQRIREAVGRGQWMPEGGMWVEADTNLSGGESLIRQLLHGKQFLQDEFGVDSELLWLPDVFGYSGNMPQIMRGCGIKYFSTAKIFWAYNGGDPFPYNTFTWEGIDGSEVLVHLCNDYNSRTDPSAVIERWRGRVQKDGIASRLLPFGWGDGGGGPTRDHLEFLRREHDLEGVPRCRMSHPVEFFRDLERDGIPSARYVGELYFQAHRGTYTSQARTKRGNRKSEVALREAEMWWVAARVLSGQMPPKEALDASWRTVLLNQFHDIIPGSSIERVYEEAEADYAELLETADGMLQEAFAHLTGGGSRARQALTFLNSLNWERTGLVMLPEGSRGAQGDEGEPLPTQSIDGATYAEVTVPSCGWTSVHLSSDPTPPDSHHPDSNGVIATADRLENQHLRLLINSRGELISVYDKDTNRELAADVCNRLEMYKDVPTSFDAWDIDSMYHLSPVNLDEGGVVRVISDGPLEARIEVRRSLNESHMVQEIRLRRGSRRVDFCTRIEWRESHKLLKVAFPVDVHANEAIHEIQFGHIRRPNHRSRPLDADRFEVAQHKWTALAEENRGVAVLNDCKYGVSVLGKTIRLTLLKAALAPDMNADRGLQEFTYSFYAWNGSLADSDLVREAYDLNHPLLVAPGWAGERSLFSTDAPNVIIEAVKPAHDGSGDVIVRLYESKRMRTRCALTTSLPVEAVRLCDLLERPECDCACEGGEIALELRPFQIQTLRLTLSC